MCAFFLFNVVRDRPQKQLQKGVENEYVIDVASCYWNTKPVLPKTPCRGLASSTLDRKQKDLSQICQTPLGMYGFDSLSTTKLADLRFY